MEAPRKPADEEFRLDTLRSLRLVGTPPEERFDRLTRIARRILEVPWSFVTLVDEERLWLKSRQGLDMEEMPRDLSFCAHAILDGDIMVVNDTDRDLRFRDNPLVAGAPGFRFYAGCPISAANGTNMGTLCVLSDRPREMNTEDMVVLRDLANICERELEGPAPDTLDALTGLTSQRNFLILSRHMLTLCERMDRPASLVYIRLGGDGLENPTHGHSEGDRALMGFADVLLDASRESDIRGRLDAEDFALLLTNCDNQRVEQVIERIKSELEQERQRRGSGIDPAVEFHAVAVQYDPDRHDDVMLLLDEAERLLHQQLHPRSKKPKPPVDPVY